MLRRRFFQKYIMRSFSHDIYSKQNKHKENPLLHFEVGSKDKQIIPIKKFEQFIENINKPKCKDCTYFYPNKTNKNTKMSTFKEFFDKIYHNKKCEL